MSITTPIFDVPIQRRQARTVFPTPRYWTKQHFSFDGLWQIAPRDLWAVGIRVTFYSTVGQQALTVLDLSDLGNIITVGSVNVADPGLSNVYWIDDNTGFYLAGGLRLFDVTNKTNPLLGNAPAGITGTASCALYPGSGNVIYVGTSSTVAVVQFASYNSASAVSVPTDSSLTTREALVYNPATGLLYTFGTGTSSTPSFPGNIVIIDVSNPAAPVKVKQILRRPLHNGIRTAMLWDSNTIIAATGTFGGHLLVIDISSPLTPEIISAWEYHDDSSQADTRFLGRRGDSLLMCLDFLDPQTTLLRVDLSDLNAPVLVDYFDGDYDTGSPLAFFNCALNPIPLSGHGLWNGLHPVLSQPTTDRVTVVNM